MDKKIIVKFETSDYVIGRIFSQLNSTNILWPVAYFFKKLTPTEYNYKIYDKELMAIIQYFKA